jgi:hypothetical protein
MSPMITQGSFSLIRLGSASIDRKREIKLGGYENTGITYEKLMSLPSQGASSIL